MPLWRSDTQCFKPESQIIFSAMHFETEYIS